MGSEFEEPIGFDSGDGSDVVLGSEDEFVVCDPNREMREDS